jgi:membrane-associated phospholipid phosphatase
VMIARVAVDAHFASDVLGGLAVTAAFTWLSVVTVRRVLPPQIRPASLQ